jgi:hypothetical protein
MKVLVGCEFSGVVRQAFARRGHEAWSCDLLPTEQPGQHLQCDVRDVLDRGWDLMIAFPPCTHLCVSGARWFASKSSEQKQAIKFVLALASAPIPRICIENPVGILSSVWRKPDQIIQPWMFGEPETKATCFWLKALPPLQPTHLEGDLFCKPAPEEKRARVHLESPGPDRWKNRSRTLPVVANAMAEQWSCEAIDRQSLEVPAP